MIKMDDPILIVDDEALIALGLKIMLNQLGYQNCFTAKTVAQAITLAQQHRPKLILMDYRLERGTNGIEAIKIIRQSHHCPVIFITGSNEQETRQAIEEARPSGLLIKPILPTDLQTVLNKFINE